MEFKEIIRDKMVLIKLTRDEALACAIALSRGTSKWEGQTLDKIDKARKGRGKQ